jgi:serine/threonine-protein kinase HipA
MITTAFVKLWEEVIGAIAWDETQQLGFFEYDKNFLEKNIAVSPLKMPVNTAQTIFSFPELRPAKNSAFNTFKGLPGLLADTLPDAYGNQLIEIWLAQQGRPEKSMNPVEQLCFIGKRAMGALEFEPRQLKTNTKTFAVEIESLVAVARKMLSNRATFSVNVKQEEEVAIKQIIAIGTSAGGARPKAVIAYHKKTGEVRSGQSNVPKGFEHWLIKLDGVSNVQLGDSQGYGRVEMAYYLMAKSCGIDMMPCELLEENGRAHFMTKRFDREKGNIKHHIQTFCAIKHFDFNQVNSFSYEQLFQTMRELRLTYKAAEQMFRRMVFNAFAKNCDDHTKNFSFVLKQNQKWELAPAYDVCYAYNPKSFWVSQHALSINGKRKDFTLDDFFVVAKSMNIKKGKTIIDEVRLSVANWEHFANEAGVDAEKLKMIKANLLTI